MKMALPTETYTFGQYVPAIHVESEIFDSLLVRPYTVGQLHSITKAKAHKDFNFYDVVNLVRNNIKVSHNGNPLRIEDIEVINLKLALINMIILSDQDYAWAYSGYCENCAKAAKDEDKIQSKKLGREPTEEESLFAKYQEQKSVFVFSPVDYSVSSVDKFSSEYIITPDEIPDLQLSFSPITVNRQYEMDKITETIDKESVRAVIESEFAFLHAQTCLDVSTEAFNHSYIQEIAQSMGVTEDKRNSPEFKRAVIEAMPKSFIDDYNALFPALDPSFDKARIICKVCGEGRDFSPPSSLKELLPTL